MSDDGLLFGPWTVEVKYTYHVEDASEAKARRVVMADIHNEELKHDEQHTTVTRIETRTTVIPTLGEPFDDNTYFTDTRERHDNDG